MTIEKKRELQHQADEVVATLDGHPARITGTYNPYGTVWTRDNEPGVQYSWDTIARVLACGGKFES